jgi:2-dehydro-3-deoxyphosphogluconate aldolase/(4S)-4-hydroxy-2-oxoglutarate aldolase
MPHLKLTPTGGVDLTTAAAWIAAGAKTLGVGTALVTKKALAEGDFGQIESLARQYVRIVADARAKQKKSTKPACR